ncbi:MAG: hypothetical protein J5950_10285 [Clostridia bacterium]|nr:hypothetical protein [Clostridia bacterium]
MAENGNNKKSGEVRLVKINSGGKDRKRYDAYGYEIPEEQPPAPREAERVYERESYGDTAESGGTGITAPGHRYDADIRAAIESGAHLRTRQGNASDSGNRTPARTAEGNTSRTPERTSERTSERISERTGAQATERTAQNRSGRSQYSHVSNRNRYDNDSNRTQPQNAGQSAAGNAGKNKKDEKNKKAARRKAKPKKEKENVKKQEEQKVEEKPLTAHEKRLAIAKAKRRRTVGNIFKVIAVVLVVALIILLITVNSNKGSKINTQYLSAGYIEDAAYGELSFLRAETPVYSAFSGVFMPSVNEGDRVSKNSVIGHVVKAEYSDALAELKEVEGKISAAKKAAAYVEGGKSGEMLALENAIDGEIDNLASLAMSGGLSGYHNSFMTLDDLFSRKNELEMSSESTDTYISGLQKERNSILNRISSSMHEVHANCSGIISFRCDGNEGRVTEASKALEDRIAVTNFTSMLSSTLSATELGTITLPSGELSVSSGQSVTNGTVLARIATENSYYITLPVDDPESHHISFGEIAEIYVPDENLSFNAEIIGLYYCGNRTIAVFKASRSLDGTVSIRSEEGRVVFTHVEGLKVPLRVLSEWDTAGVTARLTIVRSGYIRYAYVNVLGRDNDYAIINSRSTLDDGTGISVRENDEYVVNYDKVYEGQGI